MIDDDARARLARNIEERGLLGPSLVLNTRTGTLISGHQRLSVLDDLEGRDDYLVDVTAVHMTDEQEREQNVFLNNPSAMGAFDMGALHDLVRDGASPEGMGFDAVELSILLDDPEIGPQIPTSPAADAMAADIGRMDDQRKKSRETMAAARKDIADGAKTRDGVEHYVTFVFSTDAETTSALEAVGLDPERRYFSGTKLLALVGRVR